MPKKYQKMRIGWPMIFFYTEATSRQSNNFRSKMANFKPHMPLTNGRVKSTLNPGDGGLPESTDVAGGGFEEPPPP